MAPHYWTRLDWTILNPKTLAKTDTTPVGQKSRDKRYLLEMYLKVVTQ
jgi:hypothetical protein